MEWPGSSETTGMGFWHCLVNSLPLFPVIKSVHELKLFIVVSTSPFQKQTFGTITRNISVKLQ